MALNQAEKMTMKCLPMAERKLAQAGKSIQPPKHQAGQRQRCYQRPEAPPRRLGRQRVGRCRQNILGLICRKLNQMGPTCRRARVTRSSRCLRQYEGRDTKCVPTTQFNRLMIHKHGHLPRHGEKISRPAYCGETMADFRGTFDASLWSNERTNEQCSTNNHPGL